MIKSFTTRELLSWLVVAIAAFLLSISLVFAQDAHASRDKSGKITLKISKTENGKTTKIDTTFDPKDEEAVNQLVKQLGLDTDVQWRDHHGKGSADHRVMVLRNRGEGLSDEDHQKLKNEIEKEMDEVRKSMKNLRLEIQGDENSPEDFDFNFDIPAMPPMPPGEHGFMYHHGDDNNFCLPGKHRHLKENFEGLDSLDDQDHILFFGHEGEQAPVLEKEITGKHGEKAFVFKRNLPQEEQDQSSQTTIHKLRCYPNPSDGKINLTFHFDGGSDTQIQVFAPDGKEVYNEILKNFSGDFSGQIDLEGKGKGTFILKITAGNQNISRKLILE